MIRCNICELELPDDQFEKYYHSTQQKHRTRKQCRSCYYKRKNERKKKLIDIPQQEQIVQPVVPELQPDTKECTFCNTIKPLSNFYSRINKSNGKMWHLNKCKQCYSAYELTKRERNNKVKSITTGSELVLLKPGHYVDEGQRKQTYMVMEGCGWVLNEEKNIWYKHGVKDSNGNWLNLKKSNRRLNSRGEVRKHLTEEQKKEIVNLHENGYTYDKIEVKMNIGKTTIWRTIREGKKI